MHLDRFGLPMQANGDVNDQLQRVSMILTAGALGSNVPTSIVAPCFHALFSRDHLQPGPGVYVRHIGGDHRNVSGDQLISALAAWVSLEQRGEAMDLSLAILSRGGFAQNVHDMYGRTKWKVPDFILIRSLPLMARCHWALYPIAFVCDVFLVLSALKAGAPVWRDDRGFTRRTPDDVDDNVQIMTLAVCQQVMPTPLSRIAARIYAKLRPWNFGCEELSHEIVDGKPTVRVIKHSPVYGALRWYHRAVTGGNPEIAEMWRPICERYFKP